MYIYVCIYVYIYKSHFAIYLKLMPHCKLTIFQLKKIANLGREWESLSPPPAVCILPLKPGWLSEAHVIICSLHAVGFGSHLPPAQGYQLLSPSTSRATAKKLTSLKIKALSP